MQKLMVLPANDVTAIRVIQVPDDFEEHEAYRHVVGLIAKIEEENPDYSWDEIAAELEEHEFIPVEFILGPHLD